MARRIQSPDSDAGAGKTVAAVGVRHGRHLMGIEALLDAGFRVVAFDLGGYDDDPLEPKLQKHVDALLARHRDRFALVDSLDGKRVEQALLGSETGAQELLAEADSRFGETRCVYAGQWWEIVDHALGADFINVLAERGGGEFIATEADASASDKVIRWTVRWAAEPWATGVSCAVLREPSARRRHHSRSTPNTDTWHALRAAGWTGPLSLADADEVAASRLADGTDMFAGRLWEYVAMGDVDSGCILTGDADAVQSALQAGTDLLAELDPGATRAEAGYLIFHTPGGDWPYGIEVTPPAGPVEGVRLVLDADAMDFPDPYVPLTNVNVQSGRLAISDPAYLKNEAQGTLDVLPGEWMIECMSHNGALECVRLRHIGEPKPSPGSTPRPSSHE